MDKSTGYKLPKYQLDEYIHEMLQVKENIISRKPQFPIATIDHTEFIKKYKCVGGITGTIGDENDIAFLKNEYNIEPFIVPQQYISQKLLNEYKRNLDEKEFLNDIRKEVDRMIEREDKKSDNLKYDNDSDLEGRPVLIIVDSLKRLYQFKELFPGCHVITGINTEEDKQAIETAGNPGIVTIATIAAGRGIDIKIDKSSVYGGLHVIVPYKLPSRRLFEQAIGRSGRQGQPGSTTIYYDKEDMYDPPMETNKTMDILRTLQERFSNDLRINDNLKWVLKLEEKTEESVYDFYFHYKPTEQYPFGVNLEEFLELSNYYTAIREKSLMDLWRYRSCVLQMIKTSWAMFFKDVIQFIKMNKFMNIQEMRKYVEKKYIQFYCTLIDSIPNKYESKTRYLKDIGLSLIKRVDLKEMLQKVLKLLE